MAEKPTKQISRLHPFNTGGILLDIAWLALISIAYTLAVQVGFLFRVEPVGVAAIWPPSGVALAALLLSVRRKWVLVLLVVFTTNTLGNLIGDNSFQVSLGFALANITEATAGAWLITHFFGPKITFSRTAEVIALCGVATLSNGITAMLGAAVPTLAFGVPFFETWLVWWVSDGLGIILVTPIIVTWVTSPNVLQGLSFRRFIEGAILITIMSYLTWLIYDSSTTSEQSFLNIYMVFPFLIWAAMRFSSRGTVTAILFFAAISILCTSHGYSISAFADHQLKEKMLAVQILISILTISGLILATVVTERKKAEVELRLKNLVFETAITLNSTADNKGILTHVNNDFIRNWGYENKEEAVGKPISEFLKFEDEAKKIITALNEAGKWEGEYTALKKDGTSFVAYGLSTIIKDESGKVIGYQSTVLDISEQKLAEEALWKSEENYRSMMNAMKDPIYICSPDYRLEYMNPALIRSLGRNATGEKCFKAIHDLDEICTWCMHGKIFRNECFEYDIVSPRNNHHYHISCSPIVHGDGSISKMTVFKDTTDFIKMEEQFRQAQKMEAIGTLAGGVAHDFNNILTTIIGNASLALMDVGKDDTLREEIEEIREAGEKAAALTRQLLAFSRKQIIQPEILNFNELLTGIEKMLRRLISEDVELLTIPGPALWQVETDPGQMEQVIMNLVINAKDAMPKGGKLTVETVNVDLDGNYFRKHGIEEQPGSYVMLAVSDTGSGMDKETQEHIFEPFYTTKEQGRGTGLGLSTVYGIIKQNNGFIWVYSEPGQGTTFKVYLPKVKGDAELEEKEQTPVEELGGAETVLIVEDDHSLRKLGRTVLKQKGYKVLEAENGEDALRISKEHGGSIELMITDVVMPKMSGKETAERLQPIYPQMKVIFMSGYTDDAVVRHGVLEPVLNFLEKPFTPEGLAWKVREVLDK